MEPDETAFNPETAGSLMVRNVPAMEPSAQAGQAMKDLSQGSWEDIHSIYVVNPHTQKLEGVLSIKDLVGAPHSHLLKDMMHDPKTVVFPKTDQEKVVVEALKNDLKSVPVVDDEGRFLGAISADQIIDVLHEEHLEDFLRSSGIRGRGKKVLDLLGAGFIELIGARVPWLVTGLVIGLAGSFVVSLFELSLRENIALVFFMPIVPYMSGAIGTQTETIFIRSLLFLKFNIWSMLVREIMLGGVIGIVIGLLAAAFAYFLSHSVGVSTVVLVSLVLSMAVASMFGILVPLVLKRLGKDPAVGSGPFITAIQDLVSLTIYFVIAAAIL